MYPENPEGTQVIVDSMNCMVINSNPVLSTKCSFEVLSFERIKILQLFVVFQVNVRYQIVDHSDPISASAGSEHVSLEHDIAPLAELDSLLSINISCDYADETSLNRDANAVSDFISDLTNWNF